MNREKPRARLVNKHQYLENRLEKGSLFTFASAFAGASGVCLLISLLLMYLGLPPWRNDPLNIGIELFFAGGFFGVLCFGTGWIASKLFKAAAAVEKVAPITRHNTGELPAAQTLVRASERPITHCQTELLRAAGEGAETPSEQLLRAAQGNMDDA